MFFVSVTVKVHATVSKTTEGRTSTWRFCEEDGKYFALRTLPTVKVSPCKDLNDLRRLYVLYTKNPKYGFSRVELPVVS